MTDSVMEMIKQDSHTEKIERISRELKGRKGKGPVSFKKRSVSHQVPKPDDEKFKDKKIDISDLDEILKIDPENFTCVAEPGITFEDLVKETMKYGLVPLVVPELKTITIGGAVAGCSIESMSFRYGGHHDTWFEYEVITAGGKILKCTPDNENSLIFQMVHGTFGTLGVISKLKFSLIPAKPFVKVEFERFENLDDFKKGIMDHFDKDDIDFMDGFVHSPDEFVINAGIFVDEAPYTHDYEWRRSFCQNSRELDEDYLETKDYFFRYNRGVSNVKSLSSRYIMSKIFTSNDILRMADRFHSIIPGDSIPVTVDLFIPFSKVDQYLEWHAKELDHFPLWCVPYRRVRDYEWISKEYAKNNHDRLFLDLAIYGMKKKGSNETYYRMIEEELMKIGGLKTLISNNYYSEEDFWTIWNRKNYIAVKKITDPDNLFRDLYKKMCNKPDNNWRTSNKGSGGLTSYFH
jgi:FAD/FMN-containing dehydrogenase